VDVPSYKAFTDLNEELRDLGFNESMEEGAPICRWVVAGIRTDIMPIDPGILGFTNVWYSGAMDHPAVIVGPNGNFQILDAPYYCATKLEAFAARGDGDYVATTVGAGPPASVRASGAVPLSVLPASVWPEGDLLLEQAASPPTNTSPSIPTCPRPNVIFTVSLRRTHTLRRRAPTRGPSRRLPQWEQVG
jgi:hypothetical protein